MVKPKKTSSMKNKTQEYLTQEYFLKLLTKNGYDIKHFIDGKTKKLNKACINMYMDYKNCLKSCYDILGEKETYTIAGYGSLLHKEDAERTMPDLVDHELGYVHGFRRIFNLSGWSGNYLNVYPDPNYYTTPMVVAKIRIKASELPDFAFRERNYTVEPCKIYESSTKTEEYEDSLILLANDSAVNHRQEPIVTYLLLCMQGAVNLGGYRILENFLKTSDTNQGSLPDYLKNYKLEGLVQYVTRNSHIKR